MEMRWREQLKNGSDEGKARAAPSSSSDHYDKEK
jgi:hypothetical protein